MNFLKELAAKLKGMPRIKIVKMVAVITAAALFTGTVSTAGYIIYDYEQLPVEMASASVIEPAPVEEVRVEEPPVREAETEAETVELSLSATSIEKDLKIRIQDQKSNLVTGEVFAVTVKGESKGAKESEYEDKDKDGIIYIEKIDAGDYTVTLQEIEGYTIEKGTISATVKDKIEYKKVDVTAEIKTESQINTAVEDTAVNNVPEESTLTDTLPLLESKVITDTVARKDVDVSLLTKASASSEQSAVSMKQTVSASADSGTSSGGESEETPTTPPEGEEETTTPTTPPEGEDGTTTPSEGEDGTTTPSEGEEGTTTPTTPSEGEGGTTTPSEGEEGTTTPATSSDGETSAPSETENMIDQGTTMSEPTPTSEEQDGASAAAGGAIASVRTVFSRLSAFMTLRVSAAASKVTEKTASASLPKTVALYNCDNAASNSYALKLAVSGESSIVTGVAWSSSDESIVALSAKSGNAVTVTGKKNGTATVTAAITYKSDDAGKTGTVSVSSTVTVGSLTDSSTALKDKSGNTLYLDANARTVATVKDYASHDTFYTSPRYTGWQTIDGKVYYYNENNQAVTGSQVIGGIMYTFSSDGSLSQSSGNRGIDVSKYQGKIDWGAVAASGINFAIIRVGYRGSSTGVLVEDPYFKQNIAGASRAGIKVGVYFFTQAVTEAEAVEEASMAMSLVSGYNLTYPIFIDTESATNGRANGLSKSDRTAIVNAFCRTVRSGGYKAGVYASKSWFNNQLNASALNSYCIWVAQYNSECTYSGKKDMWQYTSKGKVSGISGNVDMNISYTGY